MRLTVAASALVLLSAGCSSIHLADGGADTGTGSDAGNDVTLVDISTHDTAPDSTTSPPDAPAFDTAPTDTAPPPDIPVVQDTAPPPDVPMVNDTGPPPDVQTSVHVCPTNEPMDCSPGDGTGMGDQCADAPSCYITLVQNAVRSVLNNHPEYFDSNDASCPVIINIDGYMDDVVAFIQAHGECAIRDPNAPGEEVTVKRDNTFSENFDIVASTGCPRYGGLIYTGYCAPAWW